MTEERARLYAAEVLLALEDLHRREITFCNLRTASVVLDEEGHAVLSDIGLSTEGLRRLRESPGGNTFSALFAPEILKGQTCSRATDWYCFGVLIHEMLAGRPPFWGRSRDQTVKNISAGVLKLPTDLSKEVRNLLYQLLNRNQSKRLGSGEGEAEEIRKHPWFAGIDWELALSGGLPVPPIGYKKVIKESQTWQSIAVCSKPSL